MPIASGIRKQVSYQPESVWGATWSAPSAVGNVSLRRVSSDLSLKKDTYQSEEVRTDAQVADYRHGVRRVEGTLDGELSLGTYMSLLASHFRTPLTTTNPIPPTAVPNTTTGVSGTVPDQVLTLTRAAGSWLTDGYKIGDLVKITAGSNNANRNRPMFARSVTALVLTLKPLDIDVACVADASGAVTVGLVGKKIYAPNPAVATHPPITRSSFVFEHWYPDISQSEVFTGCEIDKVDLELPPTGMATIKFAVKGRDMVANTAQQLTSPTPVSTSPITTGVSGLVLAAQNIGGSLQNQQLALLTGLTLSSMVGLNSQPVVGANVYPDQFYGRLRVTGQMSIFFSDGQFTSAFLQETEIALAVALSAQNGTSKEAMAIVLPRIKVGGSDKDDGEKGIIQTVPFVALLNGDAASAYERTTITITDSMAP